MTKVKSIVSGVLIALVIVFVVQNTETVQVRLLFWKVSMSWALMVLIALLIGIVAGWLVRGTRRK
ncbi:MAG: LapA family protein [Deltaproteobacteria bacterium]|nr:LapA family protein [Deltaproteobacteria bacterium]